jgi:hypothetical protein
VGNIRPEEWRGFQKELQGNVFRSPLIQRQSNGTPAPSRQAFSRRQGFIRNEASSNFTKQQPAHIAAIHAPIRLAFNLKPIPDSGFFERKSS